MKNFMLWAVIVLAYIPAVVSQETTLDSEQVLIYQAGQVLDLNLRSTQIQQTQAFSTRFVSDASLGALFSDYDPINDRIFLVVEREPFNIQTGIQKRSVIVLERTTGEERELYTGNNILELSVSPDGRFVLIHYQMFLTESIRPTKSGVCVLSIQDQICWDIELGGIIATDNLHWINGTSFIINSDRLRVCAVIERTCNTVPLTQSIVVTQAIPTNTQHQLLVIGYTQPYDGTSDFYLADILTGQMTPLVNLGMAPRYNSDNLAIIQDAVTYAELSDDGQYLLFEEWRNAYTVADITTGQRVLTFTGFRPKWISNSNLIVDVMLSDEQRQVYTLDIMTDSRTVIYSSTQAFNLIVP